MDWCVDPTNSSLQSQSRRSKRVVFRHNDDWLQISPLQSSRDPLEERHVALEGRPEITGPCTGRRLGSPRGLGESESRNGQGRGLLGPGAALSNPASGTTHQGQPTHRCRHPGESKRRAAVNQRPAGSRRMRSGSPDDRISRTQNVVRVPRAGPRDRFELGIDC